MAPKAKSAGAKARTAAGRGKCKDQAGDGAATEGVLMRRGPPAKRKRDDDADAVGSGPRRLLSRIPRPAGPGAEVLRVWTDCSGMDAPLWALRYLGLPVRHVHGCDIEPSVHKFWQAHFATGDDDDVFCRDLTRRDVKSLLATVGRPDMYVAGFPCPTFSVAGKGGGVADGRGQLLVYIVHTISMLQPPLFLLENVCGLLTQHRSVLQWLLRELKGIGGGVYRVDAHVLNALDHGLPHSRPRLWIIGILKTSERQPFTWPEAIGSVDLETVLEKRTPELVACTAMPPETQTQARKNYVTAFKQICDNLRINPLTSDIVADIDGSRGPHWMQGVVPCLTRARCGTSSHWVMSRGRRLNLMEMLRLMGIQSSEVNLRCVTGNQLGRMIGNSMSVHVLERLLLRALPVSGLVPRTVQLNARWESLTLANATAVSLSR